MASIRKGGDGGASGLGASNGQTTIIGLTIKPSFLISKQKGT